MKKITLRWIIFAIVFSIIGLLGLNRYNRDVKTISTTEIKTMPSADSVRLIGRIDAASLKRSSEGAQFVLAEQGNKVDVVFTGDDKDTFRELKTLVLIGRWDAESKILKASQFALIPNYDFISAAYLLSLLPLAFFVFRMERRVAMLYIMIKEEKIYQSDPDLLAEGGLDIQK